MKTGKKLKESNQEVKWKLVINKLTVEVKVYSIFLVQMEEDDKVMVRMKT